jgi:hypothetical protein
VKVAVASSTSSAVTRERPPNPRRALRPKRLRLVAPVNEVLATGVRQHACGLGAVRSLLQDTPKTILTKRPLARTIGERT